MSVVIKKSPHQAVRWAVSAAELFPDGGDGDAAPVDWTVRWVLGPKAPVEITQVPTDGGWICQLDGGSPGSTHLLSCRVGPMRKCVVLRIHDAADAA